MTETQEKATKRINNIYTELKLKYSDGLGMGSPIADHLALEILAIKRYLDELP